MISEFSKPIKAGGKGVFGRGREVPANKELLLGLGHVGEVVSFRRTESDRRPARKIVTAKLLGDPSPDRVVPETPPETRSGYREPIPAPIYLTFRAMRAAYGLDQ